MPGIRELDSLLCCAHVSKFILNSDPDVTEIVHKKCSVPKTVSAIFCFEIFFDSNECLKSNFRRWQVQLLPNLFPTN
jgi:hypothetical protein